MNETIFAPSSFIAIFRKWPNLNGILTHVMKYMEILLSNSDEYDRILGNPQCDKNSINPMKFPEPANFQHLTGFYANLLIPIISSSSVISYP